MKSKSIILPHANSSCIFVPETHSSLNFQDQVKKAPEDEDDDATCCKKKSKLLRETISQAKNQHSYTSNNLQEVLKQNQILKKQVKRLNGILDLKKSQRSLQKLKTQGFEEMDQEKKHFKKIIEKSYYSIKEMQKQIQRLKKMLEIKSQSISQLEYRYQLLQLENDKLKNKLEGINSIHQHELSLCNERIRELERKIEEVIHIIEDDRAQWRKYQEQVKKFNFRRTSL